MTVRSETGEFLDFGDGKLKGVILLRDASPTPLLPNRTGKK